MQNKPTREKELLTRQQLTQFTEGPIKMFTRNTEHWLTSQNLFNHANLLELIAHQFELPMKFLPSTHEPDMIVYTNNSVNIAMRILINSVKNN